MFVVGEGRTGNRRIEAAFRPNPAPGGLGKTPAGAPLDLHRLSARQTNSDLLTPTLDLCWFTMFFVILVGNSVVFVGRLWLGPTKPLLTNPYFGFLQFLAVCMVFGDLLGAMAWPWSVHGPNKSQKITKKAKNCNNPKYGLVSVKTVLKPIKTLLKPY